MSLYILNEFVQTFISDDSFLINAEFILTTAFSTNGYIMTWANNKTNLVYFGLLCSAYL